MGKKYRRDMKSLEKISLSKDKCESPEPSPKWIRSWDPEAADPHQEQRRPKILRQQEQPLASLTIELARRGTQVGTQVALLTSLKC